MDVYSTEVGIRQVQSGDSGQDTVSLLLGYGIKFSVLKRVAII
jgi:hypothetical protein